MNKTSRIYYKHSDSEDSEENNCLAKKSAQQSKTFLQKMAEIEPKLKPSKSIIKKVNKNGLEFIDCIVNSQISKNTSVHTNNLCK